MNEPPRQHDHIDKAVSDLKQFVYDLFIDAPMWTGNFTVHVKDGVVLDKEVTRRYKANR